MNLFIIFSILVLLVQLFQGTFAREFFSAEDKVNYPSAWDLCCNGNWDESCATMRIDCRKKLSTYYFEILKMFTIILPELNKKKLNKFYDYDF